jgi:hypothetical protein
MAFELTEGYGFLFLMLVIVNLNIVNTPSKFILVHYCKFRLDNTKKIKSNGIALN